MASFGKIQNSAASFNNENTVSLINPLTEFLPVGSALSVRRKEEAESGQIHKTACTLGFLFHEMLPDASSLFKAYGLRASEILSRSDINPHGTAGDGPLKDYIGANGTSIWAAATSGEASIAVHLLACMPARAFDAKTAISIWVEIVRGRKQEIEELLCNNKMLHPNTYVASKQNISRPELAAWDVCARAWLRRADECKARERRQFSLIVENINIPFTAPGSTYRKVLSTWTRSMQHLFPSLLVFQNKATNVKLHDPLFPSSGILSLGLEYESHTLEAPIRWSLALSHLKYYGDPVQVWSNEDVSRVTMPQLWLVALGSVFRSWEVSNSDFSEAIRWFKDLGDLLALEPGGDCSELSWIVAFSNAARYCLALENEERVHGLSLVKYGWRRATQFFGHNCHCPPFFMLTHKDVLEALKENDEITRGFSYIRNVVVKSSISSNTAFISYSRKFRDEFYTEWTTVDPIRSKLSDSTSKNHHWIFLYNKVLEMTKYPEVLEERRRCIESSGEDCDIIYEKSDMPDDNSFKHQDTLYWRHPPEILSGGLQDPLKFRRVLMIVSHNNVLVAGFSLCIQTDDEDVEILQMDRTRDNRVKINACRSHLQDPALTGNVVKFLKAFVESSSITHPIGAATPHANSDDNQPENQPSDEALAEDASAFSLMIQKQRPHTNWIRSVRALEIASILYEGLPGVTISLRIINVELYKASWFPSSEIRETRLSYLLGKPAREWFNEMTREHAFGCIAMFESGRFNIDSKNFEEVIALCTENSIFVAGILLSDPTDTSEGPRIRHLVGSIGQAGMVLLVSPLQPRIKPIGFDPMTVDYKIFAGELEMPLDWENTGEIDQEIFLLESVISVQHNGQWIADIDVLQLEKDPPDLFYSNCKSDCSTVKSLDLKEVFSIDTWEELLDPPPETGVLRAKGNWIARLAAASILIQQSKGNAIVLVADGDRICWNCLFELYSFPERHIPQFIID
ncbi:hypothetical protein F5Y13DRAFT_205995 [Hypoxylon sp. FL1857]|nr:hypothetical protein F5Y13DRAFT_205995 [Hypoxylon sp. FL1857]